MSNAFLYRMPAGIPGDVTRKEHATIEAQDQDSTTPVTLYGVPVKMASGKIKPIEEADGASDVYGFSVRPYPTQAEVNNEGLDVATPSTVLQLDILRRGYMTVKVQNGTPAKNGQVYVRIGNSTSTLLYGGLECAAGSPADCVAITGCKFMGTADDDGNVEISYNL